ncbi:MAG: hypothetical protein E7290_07985 [Lachnospiraceae bacterium]|nr:hypothetical protein [Lachnospiraceae bacterium]
MKRVLKHPLSWCACGCLVAAVGVAIIGGAMHPKVSVINKFEKAMNESDKEALAECFYDADSEELAFLIGINAMTTYNEESVQTYYLYGENELEDTDKELGDKLYTNKVIGIMKSGGQIVDTEVSDIEIWEIEGKQYIGQ